MADRRATVVWEGSLFEGKGVANLASSGLAGDLPISWPARAEDKSSGQTSPEELLAAAHAGCFSMALSKQLTDREHAPDRVETQATVTFVPGTGITKSALRVTVSASGLEEATLQEAANAAKSGCPVSQALADSVEITLDASLA